jgi:hypothetical protein
MSLVDRVTAWTLSKAINGYRRLRKDDRALRSLFHERGIWFLPPSYYAGLASPDEVNASWEYRGAEPPYLAAHVFDDAKLTSQLEALVQFRVEFDPPREGDPDRPERFFWNNKKFYGLDAIAYYAMIRYFKPNRIVEIGSGYSTLAAAEAIAKNGTGEIVCIEPYPSRFLASIPQVSRVIAKRVQDMPVEWFSESLRANDILFIDSTHTVKPGSDCLYEYLQVLPILANGVVVHAHDIFLPEGLPPFWVNDLLYHWTEQYLLFALLLENRRFEVLFGSRYHQRYHADLVEDLAGKEGFEHSSSFWFRRIGEVHVSIEGAESPR